MKSAVYFVDCLRSDVMHEAVKCYLQFAFQANKCSPDLFPEKVARPVGSDWLRLGDRKFSSFKFEKVMS